MKAIAVLPAHLQAALADAEGVVPLLRMASQAYEEAVAEGNSPRVCQGLAALAAQAAIAALRLGLLEGRVHVALGSGEGLVADARPVPGLDALTWIDAWYLTALAARADLREGLYPLRAVLPGEPWSHAWVDVLAALDGRHADVGHALGMAERLLPTGSAERSLLPIAAGILTGNPQAPPASDDWGARALAVLVDERSAITHNKSR